MLRSSETVYHSAVAQNRSICHFQTNGQMILATLSTNISIAIYNLYNIVKRCDGQRYRLS